MQLALPFDAPDWAPFCGSCHGDAKHALSCPVFVLDLIRVLGAERAHAWLCARTGAW